jgi:hypothetical protein
MIGFCLSDLYSPITYMSKFVAVEKLVRDPDVFDGGQLVVRGKDKTEAQILQAIGQVLVDENYRSVNARYRGEYGQPHKFVMNMGFKHHRKMSAVEVLALCNCYDYQACESDDYETTKAHGLTDYIRHIAIRELPGYDDAPWGLHNDPKTIAS